MENPESVTDSASLEDGKSEPKNRIRHAKLGKFAHAIRKHFQTSKMTHEDWERLESKKQIAHSEGSHSTHSPRVH